MRLPRLGDKPEDRLLEETASFALRTEARVVNLHDLKSAKGLDLQQVGYSLQQKGFGNLIEISEDGKREYHFGIGSRGFDYANEVRNALRARTLVGRMQEINWNAVNALAAMVAAVAAVLAAYFSYLSLTSK